MEKRLVEARGERWARNDRNIQAIPKSGQGVYFLYDGSTPVYVGKGNLRERIRGAKRGRRRGQLWDHFSWYIISDPLFRHDVKALFLRTRPWYLRSLNRQSGKLTKAPKFASPVVNADHISRKGKPIS